MNGLLVLLGLLDLNTVLILIGILLKVEVPLNLKIIFAVLLIAKGCIAIADIGSIIDFGAAILLVLSIFFTVPVWIMVIWIILMGSKALRSFTV